MRTDVHGRALRDDGTVIEGVYAAGNVSAPVMGHTYPGSGRDNRPGHGVRIPGRAAHRRSRSAGDIAPRKGLTCQSIFDEALGAELDPVECSWTSSDVQLYHLGLAAGADPMNQHELRYLIDDTLQVLHFHRGESAYDRYYDDPTNKPNPNLGEITHPPYYAVKMVPGDLGTKGGVRTDVHGRALRDDGSVIEGLYAAGNVSAPVMGHTYPGPGGTIGPAMTFGYLAALHTAGKGLTCRSISTRRWVRSWNPSNSRGPAAMCSSTTLGLARARTR